MNRLIIFSIFILISLMYACGDDNGTSIEPIEVVEDTCDGFNLVACSFHFRKGKWVGLLDSIQMEYNIPDTIWFKEDSLLGWSNQDGEYFLGKGYFVQNLLYRQARGSEPDDPVLPSGLWTQYDMETELLRIHYLSQFRDYARVE